MNWMEGLRNPGANEGVVQTHGTFHHQSLLTKSLRFWGISFSQVLSLSDPPHLLQTHSDLHS